MKEPSDDSCSRNIRRNEKEFEDDVVSLESKTTKHIYSNNKTLPRVTFHERMNFNNYSLSLTLERPVTRTQKITLTETTFSVKGMINIRGGY